MSQLLLDVVPQDAMHAFNAVVEGAKAEAVANRRVALLEFERTQKQLERARTGSLVLHQHMGDAKLDDCNGLEGSPSFGKVRVKAYAHNRITFCAFAGGKRKVGKRFKRADWQHAVKRSGFLDICRETRRGFKCGGRWRNLPLKTKFTTTAQNWVRDAGHMLETRADGHSLFLTLTVPGEGSLVNECLSACSGYIVDRFNRWLRYRAMNGWFVYVWELQERGTPHLHYIFKRADFNFDDGFGEECKAEWRKILLDVSEQSGVDLFDVRNEYTWIDDADKPYIHITIIQTSMSAYLAKYASKTRSKSGAKVDWFPGRWSGVSYRLRKLVLSRRLELVLNLKSVKAASDALTEIIQFMANLIDKVWTPATEELHVMQFFSAVVVPDTAKEIVESLGEWLMEGDATQLQTLQAMALLHPSKTAKEAGFDDG